MKLFARITKVDEARRQVVGRAVQEVVDKVDEVFDYAGSKPYFEAWSKSFADATEGKSLGNVRAMHGKVAAGKLTGIEFVDAEKAIDVVAHVVDDGEWKKVLEGVYTGFSIGGQYVGDRTTEKIGDREVKRYIANPSEISLVDNPCIPTAKFFDVIKADGAVEHVEFKAPALEVEGSEDEFDRFVLVLKDAGYPITRATEAIEIETMLETIDAMEKREFSADERKAAAKEGAALPDGSFPIKSKGDLANAIKAYGRAKDKAAAKAHIIKRAKALGASDMIPEAWTKGDGEKAANGEVKKGMYDVSDFAECLSCIANICSCAQSESEWEGDDSKIPMALRNWLADGIEIFRSMADEESAEMLASLKSLAGVGEDDEIEVAVEMALATGRLRKRLADPDLSLDDLAKIAKDHDEPITKAVLADMPALIDRILAKAGARHSKVDAAHLQEAHDHLAAMGATCAGGEKAATGDLLKAAGGDLQKALADAMERIKKLEAQPMPTARTVALTRSVTKQQDNATGPAETGPGGVQFSEADIIKDAQGNVDLGASFIKFTHRLGPVNAQK